MPAPASLIQADGQLTALARKVLHAVTGVPMPLLAAVRIRRASENWLHAPWYAYHRGGAITIGRRIWFTRKWFDAEGFGDGSLLATWNWLQHLAHEVGHLPQAERSGHDLPGKIRYVMAFAWQYGGRAMMLRSDVHDGAPLEIEADKGRWVLVRVIGDQPLTHPLIGALHEGDAAGVEKSCRNLAERMTELSRMYPSQPA